jgi:hypothetical protein
MKCSRISYHQALPARPPVSGYDDALADIILAQASAGTHSAQVTRQCALSAHDDITRDYFIGSVNALLGDLQARGIITLAERRDLAREWIKDYVRGCLPGFYRDKNAEAVDRLGWFLKAS